MNIPPNFTPVRNYKDPIMGYIKSSNKLRTAEGYVRVRRDLAAYAERNGKKVRQLCHFASWLVRIHCEKHMHVPARTYGPADDHILTDHALVRALQRAYGVDIKVLKDMVYSDVIEGRKFDFAGREGKILTILPKVCHE